MTTVDESYFDDALFIGDSRIEGLYEYGGLEGHATFYASTGLTIYKLLSSAIATSVNGRGKISVEEALSERQFGKIYIEVGINEVGTGTAASFTASYAQVLNRIKELQPNAVIYVMANLYVTTERSNRGDYINNPAISQWNAGISTLADGVRVFYLDANPVVCDASGGLESSYTSDGVHLKASCMYLWKNYLLSHAVVYR